MPPASQLPAPSSDDARRLAEILDCTEDAVIALDLAGTIQSWNRGAEDSLGWPARDVTGSALAALLPAAAGEQLRSVIAQVAAGERIRHLDTQWRTAAERVVDLQLSAAPVRDAADGVAGVWLIAQDVTALRIRERELARVSRYYTALNQISLAIAQTSTQEALFQQACSVLVEAGGFHLAWIGWYDEASGLLAPVASCGDTQGYLATVKIPVGDHPDEPGPTGAALRTERPVICNDLRHDSLSLPWQLELERRGFRATAAFPIRCEGRTYGALSIYATEPHFFRTKEISLLEEAAKDLSFALDNFARNAERERAEQKLRQERDFSAALLDSLPGVVYFYDETGKFLRWNANFANVTGYTAEELARSHPLDFFSGPDKARVEARIGEVFTTGQGSVEAGFVAKDGTTTPYYFTGIRTLYAGRPCLVGVGIDIGERIRAETALRESERRYRSTLDGIIEGCQLMDFNWRYLYLNDAAARHNRRPNSELLGRTMPEAWPGIERSPAFAVLRRTMEERIALHEEIDFEYPDGEHGWFDMRVQPVPEGIFVLSIDISERKRAEAALEETKTILESVVENLTEGLIIADPSGSLLRWNNAALRMLGFADLEEGRRRQREFQQIFTLHRLDGTALPPELWPLARARRGDTYQDYEVRVRRPGSDWERIFSYSGASVRYGHDRVLAFVTMDDITDRIAADRALREAHDRLEQKVAARTEQLRAAVARAEASDQIKSAFLATMSHELRTPLNSIIGFTGIVLQQLAGPLNPEQKKQIGMVRDSARHLLELINDVLDISKIEAGQLQVQAEPFQLPPSIERVLAAVRPLAAKKPIELRHHIDPALGAMHSDRRRLEQILLNLLSNALKFTERGTVTLEASLVTDFRRAPDDSPMPAVQVRVTDTGIGIKSTDLAKLFQPFRQIDTGLSRTHDGTGLGLAICRRLAILLGGTISVASEWGRGSVFTIVLPLRKPASP